MENQFKMDILDWGPAAWQYLHAVSLSFPNVPSEKDKETYGRFFVDVGRTLPCTTCQEHYARFIAEHPPATLSRETLVRWLIDVHNDVRRRQGKSTLTYDVARARVQSSPRVKRVVVASIFSGVLLAVLTVLVVTIVLLARFRFLP